jgi:hypothetical protein
MEISMGKDKALKRKTYLKLAPPKKESSTGKEKVPKTLNLNLVTKRKS